LTQYAVHVRCFAPAAAGSFPSMDGMARRLSEGSPKDLNFMP
jgi:hypothetical protein